jgi:hypothetical protein
MMTDDEALETALPERDDPFGAFTAWGGRADDEASADL